MMRFFLHSLASGLALSVAAGSACSSRVASTEAPSAALHTPPASAEHDRVRTRRGPGLVQASPAPTPRSDAPRRIGRCLVRDEQSALLQTTPNAAPPGPAAPVAYARFRQKRVIQVGHSHLSIAHLAPDARSVLAVSESEAALRLYDVETGKLIAKNAVAGYAQFGRGDFEFLGGAAATEVLFAHDGGLELLDGITGKRLRTLSELGAWELEWSDSGDVLMANLSELTGQTSRLAFYVREPARGLTLALLIECPERVDGMALGANDTRLLLSHYPANAVSLLDLKSGAELARVPGPEYARSVALAPDSASFAVGGDAVWLHSAQTGARTGLYTRFDNNVHRVRFSPDGRVLAASAYDGRVRLLQHTAGSQELALVRELRHQGTANVYTAEFSKDGKLLLTSSGDRTLRIWGE